MNYPRLVPDWVCTTPITVIIESEGLSEEGEPVVAFEADLMCNWEDGGTVRLTNEQKFVDVSGTAYFNGDICPEISNLTCGSVVVFGETRQINHGYKRRDPDGTVNYTELEIK